MRCKACDKALSDLESVRKGEFTEEYIDLCNHCFSTILEDSLVDNDFIVPELQIREDDEPIPET